MIEAQADAIYLVELCSGERRRWRCLNTPGDAASRWWRDVDSGREFSEASLMYAWRIIAQVSADSSISTEASMNDRSQVDIDRLCLAQMADALIYSDRQGNIVRWNAAAAALFGHAPAEAVGRNLDLIIPEPLRAAHWSGFARAMQKGVTRLRGQATVTRALTADGRSIYVEMSFAVITDDEGQAIGSVAVARDANDRRQEQRELRELRAARKGDASGAG